MCSGGSGVLEEVLAGAGGLGEEILALVELRERVEAALVERVGVFDATEGYAADGAYSFACWLRARADVSRGESLQLGRFARALRSMPVTEAAVAEGKLSVTKARLLADVVNERTRERFDEHESFLVDQVQGLDVDGAKVALGHWRRWADGDGPDPADPSRNRASLTRGFAGRWHLDADLDPVSGAVLDSVLKAIDQKMFTDGRFSGREQVPSAGQRTAEALVELAFRGSGSRPDQPSVCPDVVVVVPVERLTEATPDPFGTPAELVGTGPVGLEDVFRLALLGTVSTLTVDGRGRPLNLGRKQRLASGDQWIALRVRDRGCVAPGCDRPAEHCQAHHLEWWHRDKGRTDLDRLGLVCPFHHHLIHDQGWTLTHDADAAWHLTRPDGTAPSPARHPSHRPRPPDSTYEASVRAPTAEDGRHRLPQDHQVEGG